MLDTHDINVNEKLDEIDRLCEELYQAHRTFTPMYPWVLVLVCRREQQIGHVICPDNRQNKTVHEGIVLTTWDDKYMERGTVNKDGIRLMRCEVLKSEMHLGDRVFFHHFAGQPVPGMDTDRFRMVKERDWMAGNEGGIFGKVAHEEQAEGPAFNLVLQLRHLMREGFTGCFLEDEEIRLLMQKLQDRFLVVDRDTQSVSISGV